MAEGGRVNGKGWPGPRYSEAPEEPAFAGSPRPGLRSTSAPATHPQYVSPGHPPTSARATHPQYLSPWSPSCMPLTWNVVHLECHRKLAIITLEGSFHGPPIEGCFMAKGAGKTRKKLPKTLAVVNA